jgi:hypothetical protein
MNRLIKINKLNKTFGLIIILALTLVIVYGVLFPKPYVLDFQKKNPGADLQNYHLIIKRISEGGGYYESVADVLHSRGFFSKSIFNWRLPTLAWLLGHLPDDRFYGKGLAIIFALANTFFWSLVFRRSNSIKEMILGSFLISGPILFALTTDAYLSHEFWAGTMVSLSLAAYGMNRMYSSVTLGFFALIIRELTVPYVFLMFLFSIIERRKKEAFLWGITIILFSIIFVFHYWMVKASMTGNEFAQPKSWLALGGVPFVIGTAKVSPFFILLPTWLVAILFPLAVIGLFAWDKVYLGLRTAATVSLYAFSFLFIGLPYNKYWGMMFAFICPLGLFYFYLLCEELIRTYGKSLIGPFPETLFNRLIKSLSRIDDQTDVEKERSREAEKLSIHLEIL